MKDDGGGEDKVRHGRRRTKAARGRRRRRRREGGRRGGMTESERNGWLVKRRNRKRKLRQTGDTQNLKAQCGKLAASIGQKGYCKVNVHLMSLFLCCGSDLKSRKLEHVGPLDDGQNAVSIKTHQGIFCSL